MRLTDEEKIIVRQALEEKIGKVKPEDEFQRLINKFDIDTSKKLTEDIVYLDEAIKKQGLDVNYWINAALSIARELKQGEASRSYIYEKIRHLEELHDI